MPLYVDIEWKKNMREANAVRELTTATCDDLDNQGERLKRAHREFAAVHDDLNVTDRLITGIHSFWSAFANRFRFDNSRDNRKAQARQEDEIEKEMAEEDTLVAIEEHDYEQEKRKEKMRRLTERTADQTYGVPELDDYFEETDRDLDQIGDIVADIKRDSLRMRVGMVRDDKLLDRIQPEAARLEERLRKSNQKIKRIK